MTYGYTNLVAEENRKSEGELQLWDVSSGKLIRSLRHPKAGDQSNFSGPICFSPDSRIFTVNSYNEVWLWETATGKFLRALPKSYNVSIVFFSPDKALILGGSGFLYDEQRDQLVANWRLWDARSGRLVRRIIQTDGDNTDLWGFSADGKTLRGRIYTDSEIGFNALWSTRTGKLVLKAKKKSEPNDLTSPDGRAFLRFTNQEATIYNARNGRLQHILYKADKSRSLMNFQWSFSPDGKTLMERFAITTWKQPGVKLWDVATGKLKKSWTPPMVPTNNS